MAHLSTTHKTTGINTWIEEWKTLLVAYAKATVFTTNGYIMRLKF